MYNIHVPQLHFLEVLKTFKIIIVSFQCICNWICLSRFIDNFCGPIPKELQLYVAQLQLTILNI